jgi:hypothetical protein
MTGTREQEIQNHNYAAPVKAREGAKSDSHPCGGCNACHQMTQIQASSKILGWPGEGAERPTLQKPCATNFFQRNLGNSYMQSLADRNSASGNKTPGIGATAIQRKCNCGGSCESCASKEEETGKIQTKLTIGSPDDVYEQEADRVADQVMRMPDQSSEGLERQIENRPVHSIQGKNRLSAFQDITVSRLVDIGDNEPLITNQETIIPSEEGKIKTKSASDSGAQYFSSAKPQTVSDELAQSVKEIGSHSGEPLSSSPREFMENRFGKDFSNVRIHKDEFAGRISRQLNARAFTIENHIVFAPGEFRPEAASGRYLLAHELAHIIQQGASNGTLSGKRIQRTEADTQALCPLYYRYDSSKDVEKYNCAGLAHRAYTMMDLDEDKKRLFSKLGTCATSCKTGDVKHWIWEYKLNFEDADGNGIDASCAQNGVCQTTKSSTSSPDFHTVAGVSDLTGNDPTDVYSKNGRRPVYGPATGPSFKPPAKEHATLSNKNETKMYDTSGRPIYKIRKNISEGSYCVPCTS